MRPCRACAVDVARAFVPPPRLALEWRRQVAARGAHGSRLYRGACLVVICAWCEKERGGAAAAATNEPPTHGICARHQQAVLTSLPSRSFPGVEFLIVVERGRPELYDELLTRTRAMPHVAVIVDRRVGPRRRQDAAVARERRYGDRRSRAPLAWGSGYVIVRVGPPRGATDA